MSVADRSMLCGCGRTHDAQILFVRRFSQHGVTIGIDRGCL